MVVLYCLPEKKNWEIADVDRLSCTKLNTMLANFILPHIANFLDKLCKAKYLSSINLAIAYN